MRTVWRHLLDLVYPRFCVVCRRRVVREPGCLCWECTACLDWIGPPHCEQCGDPVDGEVDHAFICGWCRRHHPAFTLARSAVRFRFGAIPALHAFKYQRHSAMAVDFGRFLAECVGEQLGTVAFDAVVGVPLHKRRERERSYNQANLLAHEVAGRLGVPVARGVLRRIRPTRTQTELNARERLANVRGAFHCPASGWVRGRTFLLVDDVMTTGATVDSCSRALKEAGATAVYVVTVARG